MLLAGQLFNQLFEAGIVLDDQRRSDERFYSAMRSPYGSRSADLPSA
jgi:hypothetical protein